MQIIQFTPERHQEISESISLFCSQMSDSVKLYTTRRNTNAGRALSDMWIGKMGEFFAAELFRQRGIECTEPDLTVYDSRHKSWDADLVAGGHPVHVKTCRDTISRVLSCRKHTVGSWTFQLHDDLVRNPKREDDFVAFVYVPNSASLSGIVHSVRRFRDVALEPPRLAKFQSQKLCYTSKLISFWGVDTSPFIPS